MPSAGFGFDLVLLCLGVLRRLTRCAQGGDFVRLHSGETGTYLSFEMHGETQQGALAVHCSRATMCTDEQCPSGVCAPGVQSGQYRHVADRAPYAGRRWSVGPLLVWHWRSDRVVRRAAAVVGHLPASARGHGSLPRDRRRPPADVAAGAEFADAAVSRACP
jgi:hypothetical protein